MRIEIKKIYYGQTGKKATKTAFLARPPGGIQDFICIYRYQDYFISKLSSRIGVICRLPFFVAHDP